VRLAVVSPYSLSVPGGVQGQVRGLAAAVAGLGVEVEVLTPTGPGPAPEPIAGVPLIPLGPATKVSVNGSQAPVSPFPATVARTLRRLRSGSYDVVHLHEPFVPGPTLAALAFGPRPVVATFHRAGSDVAYRALGLGLGRLRRRIDAAVAVSAAARDTAASVLRIRGEPFEVLWNGVDLERFARAAPSKGDRPAVIFTGRHEPRKGLGVLLEAFASIPVEAELWVCGAGPETDTLRNRFGADDRVAWLGRVDDDELASRLAGADVFCSPALGGESFGLVLAEAMAAGTAVVASDIDGYREVVGSAGLLVPPGDPLALASALESLLGSPDRRAMLVEAARERVESFSLGALAERYVELYRWVAASRGRPRR
jgi:phosphatidyl-myo-inositol alpha-mannosyltransferase